jgi:hypothetical protein
VENQERVQNEICEGGGVELFFSSGEVLTNALKEVILRS